MNVHSQTSIETQLSHWYHQRIPNLDFSARLAERSDFRPSEARGDSTISMSRRGTRVHSSLPVHVRPETSESSSGLSTTATLAVPRLTRGSSTVSSSVSANTSAASVLDGGYVLSIQEDGTLTLPEQVMVPHADLLCPFQILDCEALFSDVREFKIHVFAHFRGHPAPTEANCFLCDDRFVQTDADHPALAWNEMLSHLARDHYRQGQRDAMIRSDFTLMKWMHCRKIISDAQFKRSQLCAVSYLLPNPANEGTDMFFNIPFAPTPPSAPTPRHVGTSSVMSIGEQNEPYTLRAGARAERRRRDATRTMGRRVNS